jgi:hypothetical protein
MSEIYGLIMEFLNAEQYNTKNLYKTVYNLIYRFEDDYVKFGTILRDSMKKIDAKYLSTNTKALSILIACLIYELKIKNEELKTQLSELLPPSEIDTATAPPSRKFIVPISGNLICPHCSKIAYEVTIKPGATIPTAPPSPPS